jgi:2-polyprenyl-3-methyl-5-hydroxy-6-metoxy-1,4-benzoquinol methylase
VSYLTAVFFNWVQGAPFYIDVHRQAVALLPRSQDATWLDVGCGPGLVARLAERRGYHVLGVDLDPAMIHMATKTSTRNVRCRFAVGDLNQAVLQHRAEVVSAASLLFVMPDPTDALHKLWQCVRPSGNLLVVETTSYLTPGRARQISATTPAGRRLALHLWARARLGRAVSEQVFQSLPAQSCTCTPLLNGLVHAWIFVKGTE